MNKRENSGALSSSDGWSKFQEPAGAQCSGALHSVFEASADCIKIIGLNGQVEFMNSPGLRAMEVDDSTALFGQYLAELWPEEAKPCISEAIILASAGRTHRFSGFCPTAKGNPRWWDVIVSPILDAQGKIARILSISRDITQARQTEEQLTWASEHDPLTNLPNRRAFEAQLDAASFRAWQSGCKVGLLLIDLDHFKHINDTLGHAAGDHLLTIFAARLKRRLHAGNFLARIGGDEFAVIIEGCGEKEQLQAVGTAICTELKRVVRFEHHAFSAGCSIGGAIFPSDAKDSKELLRNADIALYALKDCGRGGTQLFDSQMRADAQLVSAQLSLARTAVTTKSVEPHYQQKVDLRTGQIVGFEALLRWRRARQLYLPETVAEAFKDYELASKIGDLMQRGVFADLRRWLDMGLPVGPIAINAAPAEFLRDDFAERTFERLHECKIPASLLEIEVTEHALLDRGSDYAARALHSLSRAGVKIALDDFGTGHSSLSHLRDFPVDVVKIDRSFTNKILGDHEVRAIVAAVCNLAVKLKIDVVAEGVENEFQRALLLTMGCPMGQGYLFGMPVSGDEIEQILTPKISEVA